MYTDTALRQALSARKQFILDNLETVSLKKLRGHLEQDLDVEKDALKPYKHLIADFVDQLMSADQENRASNQKPGSADANKESNKIARKQKEQHIDKANRPVPRVVDDKKVERLRALCRAATIPIPPNVYVKNKSVGELTAALAALLSKHGLTPSSSSQDVVRVKNKLQLQRDLDGIDASNIISDGRRPRRATAVARSYRNTIQSKEDQENTEGEEATREILVLGGKATSANTGDEPSNATLTSHDGSFDESEEEGGAASASDGDDSEGEHEAEQISTATKRSSPKEAAMEAPPKKPRMEDWSEEEDD